MKILRFKTFSSSDKGKDSHSGEKALASGIGSLGLLGSTKTGRLTGKVTRYHNTENKNVQNILEEGLKSKYSDDPNNLTNMALRDIDKKEKSGLVYTSKKRRDGLRVGTAREYHKSVVSGDLGKAIFGPDLDDYKNAKKNSTTLKLEFDYDDLKNKERIKNPELRGAKTWKEYQSVLKQKGRNIPDILAKEEFETLDKGTHIFRGDISPNHIVGGKGYKKRSMKQIGKYIKNNPGRFGKEAAKVGAGVGLGIYSGKKAYDVLKEKNSKTK
jgi:hypothetical protein